MSFRILEKWLRHHRNVSYPDSDKRRDAFMAPCFPLRSNGWYWDQDISSLGYSYLELRGPQPDEGGSQWQWLGPVLGVSGIVLLCGGIWAANAKVTGVDHGPRPQMRCSNR